MHYHTHRLTTKGSETANLMLDRRAPVALLVARHSSRNGGFWPDNSASELPVGQKAPFETLQCEIVLRISASMASQLPSHKQMICFMAHNLKE